MKKILVLAAAAVLVLAMSAPSWAVAEFQISGSVRLDTGWRFSDLGDVNGPGGEDSQTQFFLQDPGNSRIAFKTSVGDVMGFFELGFGPGVDIRHAYFDWNMGAGSSLLVGHTWSIAAFEFTDQRLNFDLANIGFGCLYFGRNPQVRYTYSAESWNLAIAAEDNKIEILTPDIVFDPLTGTYQPGTVSVEGYLTETWFPLIEAAAELNFFEMVPLRVGGWYQMIDLTGIATGTGDVDVDSWGLTLSGRVKLDFMKIIFQGWWGTNVGLVAEAFEERPNATTVMGAPGLRFDAAGNFIDIEDADSYGGFVEVSFPLETFAVNAGVGAQSSEIEFTPDVGLEDSVTTWAFFVNVLYNITDAFYVQPEFVYFDYGDDAQENAFGAGNNDLGSDIYVGIHFQADF